MRVLTAIIAFLFCAFPPLAHAEVKPAVLPNQLMVEGNVGALAFSPDAKTLAFVENGRMRLFDVQTWKEKEHKVTIGSIGSIAFSPDGSQVALGLNWESNGRAVKDRPEIRLVELATGKTNKRFVDASIPYSDRDMGSFVPVVAFSADGKSLGSVSHVQPYSRPIVAQMVLWEIATSAKTTRRLPDNHVSRYGRPEYRGCCSISTVSWIVSEGSTAGLRDMTTGKESKRFALPNGFICSGISGDGKTMVLRDATGIVKLCDTANGKELCQFSLREDLALVSLSADGKVLAWVCENDLFAADVDSLQRGLYPVDRRAVLSPDKKIRAVPRTSIQILLYDTVSRKKLKCLNGGSRSTALVFSTDSKILASAGVDRTIRLIDPGDTRLQLPSFKVNNTVESLSFSLDGRTLTSRESDRTIRVWDIATGKEVPAK